MFAGILCFNKKITTDSIKPTLYDFIKTYDVYDKILEWSDPFFASIQGYRQNHPASAEHNNNRCLSNKNFVIVAWARLDNRDELAQKLDIPLKTLQETNDTSLLFQAFMKYGEECTRHIYGDFAFIVYDIQKKTIFCARDHMGIKPFYYYHDNDVFVFSSSIALFHKLDFVPVNPDMEWASRYLIGISMDFEKTAYDKIYKLRPAQQLNVSKNKLEKKLILNFIHRR